MTAQKKLHEVGQDAARASDAARAAPYPADTRARGWRFELDYEQIEQSDTWSLAAEVPMAQHALLMMWMVAWSQVPCGSFPNDEAVIRAKCRIPPPMWSKCRAVLMRGWWAADDGRLYHDTLVKRVMEMMARRRSDADRQAARRSKVTPDSGDVTPVSRVTPRGVTRESSTDNRLPNTSSSSSLRSEEHPPKPPRKRRGAGADAPTVGVEQLVAEGVGEQHAKDWLTVRKAKKLPLTLTAWEDVKAEAQRAGLSIDVAVHTACVKSWGGFKAKWLDQEAAADAVAGGAAANWWESKTGLTQRGAELDVAAPEGDHPFEWAKFKARLWVAAGDGPWWDHTSIAYPIAVKLRDGATDLAQLVTKNLGARGVLMSVPHETAEADHAA